MVLMLLEKKICSEIVKIPHVKEGGYGFMDSKPQKQTSIYLHDL